MSATASCVVLLLVVVLLSTSLVAADSSVPKLELVEKERADAVGAACLDGSPPAYYYAPATSDRAKDTWVLYFKGRLL
jgi:hypothetical protein